MPKSEVEIKGRVKIFELLKEPMFPHHFIRSGGRLLLPDYTPASQPYKGELLRDSGNHVTSLGRLRVAELISGHSAAFIDRIAVGDGGLFEGTSTPKPPRNDQTELDHELVRLERKTVVLDVDIPTVIFVGIFKNVGSYQFAQPGVAQISELALYTPDDVACAIYNFAPLPVDVHRLGFMVEWEWGVK